MSHSFPGLIQVLWKENNRKITITMIAQHLKMICPFSIMACYVDIELSGKGAWGLQLWKWECSPSHLYLNIPLLIIITE